MRISSWNRQLSYRNLVRGSKSRRRGQTLPMLAMLIVVLLAFMGLVFDGGLLYYTKRSMQTAADAGALAGATELWRLNTDFASEVRPAVINDTSLNGYNDSNATISVNNPPLGGANVGDPGFVEVIISQDRPTSFMRVLNFTQANVKARAVAGLVKFNESCVLALDRTKDSALKTNGNPVLFANCGVMSNSASASGLNGVGSSIVTGSWIGVSGDYTGGGSFNPTPETDVPPMMDPLAYLGTFNYAGAPAAQFNSSTNTYSCPTGVCVVSNQVKITGGNYTFEAGNYVLQKGMQITGGNVTGTGVSFYNVNASGKDHIDIGGNGVVQFSAPTSGPMKGILFYADPNSPDKPPGNKIGRGNSNSFFQGALYFPSQHLDWAGNPQTISAWTMVVANTINVSGTADVQQIALPGADEGPDIFKPTLVE